MVDLLISDRGHFSSLDILHPDRKIILELKSRWNTDNANSRRACYDKLARFKACHPDYTVIYGFINPRNEPHETTRIHNGQTICEMSGKTLLKFLLGDDWKRLVDVIETLTSLCHKRFERDVAETKAHELLLNQNDFTQYCTKVLQHSHWINDETARERLIIESVAIQ